MITRMKWFTILIHYFILLDIALALALAGGKTDNKDHAAAEPVTTKTTLTSTTTAALVTTQAPPKAGNKEQVDMPSKQSETLEKPLPKKRGAIEDLYHSQAMRVDENGYDGEEVVPEEIFSNSRSDSDERPYYRYGDSAFVNDDGYFENDGRRKRTAMYDGYYNRPQEYANVDTELTPQEILALLSLLDDRRVPNSQLSMWPEYDNTIDSIEADMRDEDVYRERPDNRVEDSYDAYEKYPTGMKRYMITRRRRSNYNPKLRIPVFRRAIL